jgi:3-hydroxyacyl-CoA dehydrogenase/enoyl-CoA hydratase/3-hydroxybutyryl-CoA epimerase
MGSGIAHVCARAGLDVVLIDRSEELAAAGRERILRRESAYRARSGGSADCGDALGELIHPSSEMGALRSVDLAIEAVFEDLDLKQEILRRAETELPSSAIIASNTSTLPISILAKALHAPERFIGLHFFSPVDRMQLLEVIASDATSKETLRAALGFARQIGKIAISVNDSYGFYTTRIIIAYIQEANEMLAEGVSPDLVEAGAMKFGMPLGPLALCDEIALTLMHQINLEKGRLMGDADLASRGAEFLGRMVAAGRGGRNSGGGYYDYAADGSRSLWAGLKAMMPTLAGQPDVEAVAHRIGIAQSLEAIRALDEGVLSSPADGDIGAMLGWGFPMAIGGPFSYADWMGLETFERSCAKLKPSFSPPAILRTLVDRGTGFYEHSAGGGRKRS